MASRYSILPGMGGRADIALALTSGAAAAKTDEYDCSLCAQLALQVKTWAAGNLAIAVEQSFDGTNFKTLVASATKVVGDTIQLDVTQGPFGIIRLSETSSDTSATATVTLIGYPMQASW